MGADRCECAVWRPRRCYWWCTCSASLKSASPSGGRPGYLCFCPLWFAGILWLVRHRTTGVSGVLVADAVAAALAVGALCAAIVVQPVLANATGGTLSIGTNLAYPLCDMLLLGLIVGATAIGNWRLDRTWAILALSVVVFWIADSMYLVTVATNTYSNHEWFNPLWYASPVIAAWAAWLPPQAVAHVPKQGGVRGIVLPVAFATGAVTILVWSEFDFAGVLAIVLATGSLLVIMCRFGLTWRENATLYRSSIDQAMTDPPDRFGNRRALSSLASKSASTPGAPSDRRLLLIMFDLDGLRPTTTATVTPPATPLYRRLGTKLRAHLQAPEPPIAWAATSSARVIDTFDDPFVASVQAAYASSPAEASHGEGFSIGCFSHRMIVIPTEAHDLEVRCGSSTSGCTRTNDVAGCPPRGSQKTFSCAPSSSARPTSEITSRDVGELAAAIAQGFSLSPDEVEVIRHAAELHDIGKVAIPDAILDKPATDERERAFMQAHTLIGERIIAEAPALRAVATLVRSSHENFDGTGYPDGLAGHEIPLGSRIIAACDALHAMTNDRPYSRAISRQAAIAELRRCAGTQFDPLIIERLCLALDQSAPHSPESRRPPRQCRVMCVGVLPGRESEARRPAPGAIVRASRHTCTAGSRAVSRPESTRRPTALGTCAEVG